MNRTPSFVCDHLQEINALCRQLAVRELQLFGSALTDKFDPAISDMDFLVVFFDSDAPGIADRYLILAEGLESIFQRPVDLVTKQSVKNPVFRETLAASSQMLYAA